MVSETLTAACRLLPPALFSPCFSKSQVIYFSPWSREMSVNLLTGEGNERCQGTFQPGNRTATIPSDSTLQEYE